MQLFDVFHEDISLFKEYCLQDEDNYAGTHGSTVHCIAHAHARAHARHARHARHACMEHAQPRGVCARPCLPACTLLLPAALPTASDELDAPLRLQQASLTSWTSMAARAGSFLGRCCAAPLARGSCAAAAASWRAQRQRAAAAADGACDEWGCVPGSGERGPDTVSVPRHWQQPCWRGTQGVGDAATGSRPGRSN